MEVGGVVVLELVFGGGFAFLVRSMFVDTRLSERASDVSCVRITVTGWLRVIPPPPKNGPGNGPGNPKNPPPPRIDPVG